MMYKLHIYNPEHDMALASGKDHFTLSRAARITRNAFGHIPAFWAENGDWVIVDDVEHARQMLQKEERSYADVKFVTLNELSKLSVDELPVEIVPWGWDYWVVKMLLKANPLFSTLLPTVEELDCIRLLSSRAFAAENILPELVALDSSLVGEMNIAVTMEEIYTFAVTHSNGIVLKSPWSCSGRGVRIINESLSDNDRGWCRNILREQGLVMVEPRYDNVLDFAMEFYIERGSGTQYLGINIFDTKNGAYIGNKQETEDEKLSVIMQYVPKSLLYAVRNRIIELTSDLFHQRYAGPFGIDMMITTSGSAFFLHPCIELNLRRTMGHASLEYHKTTK